MTGEPSKIVTGTFKLYDMILYMRTDIKTRQKRFADVLERDAKNASTS